MKLFGRIAIVTWAIVLLAVGCNKAQPQTTSQQSSPPVNQEQATSSSQTVQPSGQTQTRQNAGGSDYQPAPTPGTPAPTGQAQTIQNAGKPDYTPGYVVVTDTVEGSNLNYQYDKVKDGTTAYGLLASTHQVTAKDYGAGMGEMVLSIDGIRPASGQFWEFLVNGQFSNVGASSYILKDGDAIEWKLEAIK